jgi:hypothetical protein
MDYSEFQHSCRFCKNGTYIKISREVFCKHSGVVRQKHICKKYEFDPFKVKIKRKRVMDVSKFSAEDFSIE